MADEIQFGVERVKVINGYVLAETFITKTHP